jgi:Protein of unknown function (DUF1203)
MTTATEIRTDFVVRPIAPDVVRDLLEQDDAGHSPRPRTDEEGGSPLRCCLRRSEPGERIALVSYAPLRRWAQATGADPGPYDEVGPVFLHAEPCGGPAATGCPPMLSRGKWVLRSYSADGHILGGQPLQPGPDEGTSAASELLAGILARPGVEFVHVRAMEFGCYLAEVRRG